MKSAERYKYEANCNIRRALSFERSAYITAISSVPAELAFGGAKYLLLVSFAAAVGWTTSNFVAGIKDNLSTVASGGVSVFGVDEKHRITRRRLYKS